ncbi:transcription factor bHLH30-like [Cucurbita pepo subsp. pepo]|uniref:transcription factor bHLH30-like n=1 Tax=Cucurbita pepo subsp. pepo TaxID=3664 RepID=UPI000C9DA6A6|nr:transcription factor bHLH30-like [Cucurbita pepo subsp. pepo]
MLPFQSHYEFQSSWLSYRDGDHFKRSMSTAGCSIVGNAADSSKDEKKSTEASRSHKEAERRRRQRINSHLSTLRTLLPNTTKTDKASLLAEVVSHVKELRRRATEVAHRSADQCDGDGGKVPWAFPSEEDEATLCYCDNENRLMRATVCCDERSGLNRDLIQAIRSVHARVVRAEMMTLGGRTKNVVVLEWSDGGDGGGREEAFVGLRRALKAVVENQAQNLSGHKRARACCPIEDPFYMC